MFGADDHQPVGADYLAQRLTHRLHQRRRVPVAPFDFPVVLSNQMRQHLCICAGTEGVSRFSQTLFEPVTILDDSVVHHSKDRKSTRLNSSHSQISYAVFCLKKKKHNNTTSVM